MAPVPPGSPGGLHGIEGPVTRIGVKTILGTTATGYAVIVSVEKLIAEAATTSGRDIYRAAYLDVGVRSFHGDVWLDGSGHIREISWSFYVSETDKETQSVETFTYSTHTLAASAPPVAQTIRATGDIVSKCSPYSGELGECIGYFENQKAAERHTS